MKLKEILLSCVTALTAVSTAVTAAASNGLVTETVSQKRLASASGVNISYRSQEDIRGYLGAHPFSTTEAISFGKQPDMTSPYESSGALDSSTLNNGLNAINVTLLLKYGYLLFCFVCVTIRIVFQFRFRATPHKDCAKQYRI